jgi:hypothetical protein
MSCRSVRWIVPALAFAIVPCWAASGRVTDPAGKPLVGAKACFVANNKEGKCALTDAQGHYSLPDDGGTKVRILAPGFLARTVAAVDQESPIVLNPAAKLRARLVDAKTGKPIAKGELRVTYPSGAQTPIFPVNAAGLVAGGLPPGIAMVSATANGYRPGGGLTIELVAGQEASIEVKLQPEK